MKTLRVTICLKVTEQFPMILFIVLQKFKILTWNLWKNTITMIQSF